jgi:hypothetical protein
MKINPVTIWPGMLGDCAPLHTILFLVVGRRFDVTPCTRDEIVDSLLYNMKLELNELDVWMTRYTYVFPDAFVGGFWNMYRGTLLENMPTNARFLRVEVPRRFDATVAHSIHTILSGNPYVYGH